jgi:CRISPR-associated protein Cas1
MEGQRVKATYRALARQYGYPKWRRETDPEKATDPVNPLINLANGILYGSATAAVSTLGLNPGLGIIHEGSTGALLFDLADLHKIESSIPLAFKHAQSTDATHAVRRGMRNYLHSHHVLVGMVQALMHMLEPHVRPSSEDRLLDDQGTVPGMTNYG